MGNEDTGIAEVLRTPSVDVWSGYEHACMILDTEDIGVLRNYSVKTNLDFLQTIANVS